MLQSQKDSGGTEPMSKAFTKESDDEWAFVPEPPDPLPKGVKNYVTPFGAEQLREELSKLNAARPDLLALVNGERRAQASEPGSDLPPRQRLDSLDRRIRFLTERITTMVLVDSAVPPSDRVRFGAKVVLEDADGARREYQIVGVDEADPAVNKVSFLSPIAKALLSREEGDEIRVELPDGSREFEIVSVSYPGHQ